MDGHHQINIRALAAWYIPTTYSKCRKYDESPGGGQQRALAVVAGMIGRGTDRRDPSFPENILPVGWQKYIITQSVHTQNI